jgi:undecaprenyl-phosphate 4-deoxy-4-formamido-L-arabinose transferase
MTSLSIVIPVYCGEQTVVPLYEAIQDALEGQYEFKIIFVHDCGPDNSLRVLRELRAKHADHVEVVALARNFGQHNAIICGFTRISGDLVVTMDEDLQHDPKDIIPLVRKQQEDNYDVVYGDYDSNRQHNGFRNSTSRAMKHLLSKAIPELHPQYSAFRVIRPPVASAIIEMRNSYTFLDGYLSWLTTHVTSIPVHHHERKGGRSGYTTKALIEHAINVFVTFSNYPIRLMIRVSMVLFLVTLVFSLYVVFRKILAPEGLALGYASLIISSGFGTGLVLLALGVVGEYLHRVNQKTTRRPNFFLRDIPK